MDCKQQMDGVFLQRSHGIITSLVFALFLQSCRGQPQLIGPSKPIVARIGDDITLPCYLKPATMDVTAKTLEWTRADLDPVFVFVWRAGREFEKTKHSSYKGRTSLFTDELRHGNMSLKLSKVNLSDKGKYKCYIVEMDEEFFIDLVVASDVTSSPVLSLAGIEVEKGEVTLRCESAGWYPEPELLWWDGEGNLLSAGPTETLRGPDGLYTVSSRVTVEKRHSNNITCRVQQKNINQSRETHIRVSDDFLMFTCSSAAPIVIGWAVSLALSIMVILFGGFFIWRQNKTKVKRGHCDEAEKQEMMNRSENDKTETEQEQEKLMTQDIMPFLRNSSSEEQRRKEAENEAESMRKKVDRLMAEVEKLKEEKQQLQHLLDAKEQKHKPLLGHRAGLMNLITATTSSELEKNQEADKKLKDSEELNQQLEKKKDAEIRELKKQVKKNQEADKKMKEDNEDLKLPLERKSSCDKETVNHGRGEMLMELIPATTGSELEKLQEAAKKLKEYQEMHWKQQRLDAQLRELNKLLEKYKKMEENKELKLPPERKPSCDKEKSESSKLHKPQSDESLRHSQEQNQSSSANHSSMRGDIILEAVDRNGSYLCLKNISREDTFLGGWELKLQVNQTQPMTYKFKVNYTLRAGRTLTLRKPGARNPNTDTDDLMWMDLTPWSHEETLKINLISNTGEEHRLK